MQLGRTRSHTLREKKPARNINTGSLDAINRSMTSLTFTSRARTQSLAENVICGQETYEFEIPSLSNPLVNTPPQQRRNRSRTLLEEIDLTMYKDKTKEKKPDLSDCCYNQDRTHEIGKIKCSLQFLKNKILVEILSVDVKHHPSSFVNGSTWIIKPLMKIEVKKNNQSPTVKRKQSVFQSITQKTEVVWTTGHCCELPFKNKQPSDYNLRLTLYDADRHNTELVIGYFHVPIENIAQAENALFVEDDIVPNSQSRYATSRGEIVTRLKWNSNKKSFDGEILSCRYEKYSSESNTEKDLFVKATLFVGSVEVMEHKTGIFSSAADVSIDKKFNFFLGPPHHIHNTNILLQLFEKHSTTNECVGRSLIGPYMPFTEMNNTQSCWEKMIIDPNKDIEYRAIVYQ